VLDEEASATLFLLALSLPSGLASMLFSLPPSGTAVGVVFSCEEPSPRPWRVVVELQNLVIPFWFVSKDFPTVHELERFHSLVLTDCIVNLQNSDLSSICKIIDVTPRVFAQWWFVLMTLLTTPLTTLVNPRSTLGQNPSPKP
jgi:hypothetical protein